MKYIFLLLLLATTTTLVAQDTTQKLAEANDKLLQIKNQEAAILEKIETLKLNLLQEDLNTYGLPKLEAGEELIKHSAMTLVYDEKHEQAKWVAHIILPDIIEGSISRSNDFRQDPKIKTGSAEEKDYFLKSLQPDSTYKYDGFGYDRGHLAPSADFRWSALALSESYYYSNMSPQAPDFNRERWGELEAMIRGYLYRNPTTQLYVVTGPVLTDDLPILERSINKVTIPQYYFKVVLDLKNQKSIAFIMPNQLITYPIESFAVSIDEVENQTGIDFFAALDDSLEKKVENQTDPKLWLPQEAQGNISPIYAPSLPKGHFNTVQARKKIGKQATICGTVVSGRKSRKGNILLKLDKKDRDEGVTIFIRKENIVNFSYDPIADLIDSKICISGDIYSWDDKMPVINLDREEQIKFWEEIKE